MNFEFITANRIIVDRQGLSKIPQLALDYGKQVLVVGRKNSTDTQWLVEEITRMQGNVVKVDVTGEPTIEEVERLLTAAKQHRTEVVVAIGGGSNIDMGKILAALMTNHHPLIDYLEVIGNGVPITQPSLPLIAIPTTAGTGAEVTKNAVVSSPTHRVKVSLRSPYMMPNIVVIDPNLSVSVPPAVTAATGLDALTQVVEPYVTKSHNYITDAVAVQGMQHIRDALLVAYHHSDNLDAREQMAIGSLFGGMALANAKLGAVHGFAAVLGGMYPIPHGVVCGKLLPIVTAINIQALQAREPNNEALNRYLQVSKILNNNHQATVDDLVTWLNKLCMELDVPGFASYGVKVEDFPEIIEKSLQANSMKGNPIALTYDECHTILNIAL